MWMEIVGLEWSMTDARCGICVRRLKRCEVNIGEREDGCTKIQVRRLVLLWV